MDASVRRRTFFEVHRDLPREGPGDTASTRRALALVTAAAPSATIGTVLDVGCGPGMQTVDLARALPASRVVAVDLHQPFLATLQAVVRRAGFGARILPVRADMQRLPLAPGSVDLVWCEAAAYVMGVGAALAGWHELLGDGGLCAFSEAVWLRDDPPAPVRDFWTAYPAMGDVAACRTLIAERGFRLVGDFVLPSQAWWDNYYSPMGQRLAEIEARADPDPNVRAVLEACRREIDLYREYADWYGYSFFVCAKV